MFRSRSLLYVPATICLGLAGVLANGGCATTHEWENPVKGAFVMETDVVIPDPVILSKSRNHVVKWFSWPGTTLKISFADTTVFPALKCTANKCDSGPIAAEAALKDFDYTATVTGLDARAAASKDPKVRIKY